MDGAVDEVGASAEPAVTTEDPDAQSAQTVLSAALDEIYGRGCRAAVNVALGAELLHKAAGLGSVEAWGHLARLSHILDSGLPPADKTAEAVALWKARAEGGDADAQFYLGSCYFSGNIVPRDDVEGARLSRSSADQGNASAQANLGRALAYGIGVGRDLNAALRYNRLSAEQGHASGITNLGVMHRDGLGVEKDLSEAARLFRKAADLGDCNAMLLLGDCYTAGLGVEKSLADAAQLYRACADGSRVEGMLRIARCYAEGIGVPCDPIEAVRYNGLACGRGNRSANRRHDKYRRALWKLGWTVKRHHGLKTEVGRARVRTFFLCQRRDTLRSEVGLPAMPIELWMLILQALTLGDLDWPTSQRPPHAPKR
eukprot:m.162998 g.162998  ORF g.162998 m.162998 type:complete len:371 (+) comp14616_c0_seq2:87-1199(+)